MTKCLAWTEAAWQDYLHWQSQDKKTLKRINKLIADALKDPFTGIGNRASTRNSCRFLV
ncbi:type II toxin-antitoxin system YoeB family toxin [Methylocucumis oryzae]|uniref:type II toxin-antitoxin system YoeB family toxin n=1 Tax=Methylocucumis oryzae TaxID=1632867 RepID=UPI003F6C8778